MCSICQGTKKNYIEVLTGAWMIQPCSCVAPNVQRPKTLDDYVREAKRNGSSVRSF